MSASHLVVRLAYQSLLTFAAFATSPTSPVASTYRQFSAPTPAPLMASTEGTDNQTTGERPAVSPTDQPANAPGKFNGSDNGEVPPAKYDFDQCVAAMKGKRPPSIETLFGIAEQSFVEFEPRSGLQQACSHRAMLWRR